MFQPKNSPPRNAENEWRFQLDRFVQENQQQIAALCWGLRQEWGDTPNTLGIDWKPTPHFVACSRDAIERLNQQVNQQLREVLGVLDGYSPEKEVVIIGIGDGQVKLINFQPEPPPPQCFEDAEDLDTLIEELEQRLREYVKE